MYKLLSIVREWKIKDYLRQLSIVVIGICITFIGNDLIGGYYKRKQLNEILNVVKREIDDNKLLMKNITNFLEQEYHFYSILDSCRFDISQVSEDTLKKYHFYPFMHESPVFMKDAMGVLKVSNLTEQIKDKSFLIDLIKIYSSFDYLESITKSHFDLKITYIPPLMMNADKELFEKLTTSSRRESWELFWEDNYMRNFILTSTGSLPGILREYSVVEEAIDKLQSKLADY